MGFGSLIRDVALPLAKDLLGGQDGILDDVTIQFWESDSDAFGTGSYSDPVSFQAVVIREQKEVRSLSGEMEMATTYVAFLEEIAARGTGNGRKEPIDARDIITLSDGSTGRILSIAGLMDQVNSTPYYHEVYLG